VIKSFIVGAIAGGAAVWLWGDALRDYLDEQTRDVRTRAAAPLHAVAETVESLASNLEGPAQDVERAV
jgi:hypothetical protein